MNRIEKNIAKSFRIAKEDIRKLASQLDDLFEKHRNLQEIVNKLKSKSK